MNHTSTPFLLRQASLGSTRSGTSNQISVDITEAVADISIYEHLNKPYTTATVSFVDNKDTLSSLDIQGGEYIDINIASTQDPMKDGVKKRFYITEIVGSTRAGDRSEMVVLNCVDKFHFQSYLQNCNDVLEGSPLEMIVEVAQKYFSDLNIVSTAETYKERHKVIVPNKTPLDALVWLNKMSITEDGLPYYLYSTLGDDYLRYYNLGELILQESVFRPLVYGFQTGSSDLNTNDNIRNSIPISRFEYKNAHDIYKFIDQGFFRSNHSYYDMWANKAFGVDYACGDTFAAMHNNKIYKEGQTRYPIPSGLRLDNDVPAEGLVNRNMFSITTSRPYNGYRSYSQRPTGSTYYDETTRKALKHFMTKDPITIQFDGKYLGLLSGMASDTFALHLIGKKLKVFFGQTTDGVNASSLMDLKKSGEYIAYAVKHQLNRERYDVLVTGVKMASFDTARVDDV